MTTPDFSGSEYFSGMANHLGSGREFAWGRPATTRVGWRPPRAGWVCWVRGCDTHLDRPGGDPVDLVFAVFLDDTHAGDPPAPTRMTLPLVTGLPW
jgi:hypothetical protein